MKSLSSSCYHNADQTGLPDPMDLLEQSFNESFVVLNIN
jgi:hypothetical protein